MLLTLPVSGFNILTDGCMFVQQCSLKCMYCTHFFFFGKFCLKVQCSGVTSSLGFPLNDQLFQMIIRRYSDESGNMDFDNYIGCLVRLDAMCRKLKDQFLN